MDEWVTLKEAIEEHPLARITIMKRIAVLKKFNPLLYVKIVRKAEGNRFNRHEVMKKEFFAFLNTDLRVFKRNNTAARELKDKKEMDDPDPSIMRMLIILLAVNDIHEIDENTSDTIKVLFYSRDSFRFQKAISICYYYTLPDETFESACLRGGATRQAFRVWRDNIPLVAMLHGKAKMIRYNYGKEERKDAALRGLSKLLDGYDKILPVKKYRIKVLRSGQEVLIPYEMSESVKHVPPNVAAIALELYNQEDGDYKRVPPMDGALPPIPDRENEYDDFTEQQLDDRIKQLEDGARKGGAKEAEKD